ncbi:MAG: hypothetical protein CM15mV12_1640 [uncultured marine virus]|nr:MAG: hypothetical protein CM15mV12_1640 [uncultured marine virus]
MGLVQNLKKRLNSLVDKILVELSYHYIIQKAKQTTKREQLFTNKVLTEQLDDGTPKYYNSNILSRYFRKDYYGNEND